MWCPRAEQIGVPCPRVCWRAPLRRTSLESGFWFKDGNTFINIGSVLPDGSLRKVRVFEYRDATHLGRTMTAEAATFLGGQQWTLDRVTETDSSVVVAVSNATKPNGEPF